MSKDSLNDSFIHLQVELQKFRDEGSKNEDLSFQYHQFSERRETRVQTIINQSWLEIHDFRSMIKVLTEKKKLDT